MTLYAVICHDKPQSLELRQKVRPDHLAYVTGQALPVVVAGALREEDDTMIGSLIVVEAASLAEAEAFSVADPYRIAGLFASVTIRRWTVSLGAVGESGKA
jgi:uncharacterized protein YciI